MSNPEAFADMVVMTVKAALGPVLADVKSLQTQLAGWESRWNDVGALRERVAVVESKAATELHHEPVVQPVTDLGPVQERLAAAEARLTLVGDLRDRVIAVETKVAAPSPSDPVVHEVRDRVLALESKSQPVLEVPADVLSRLSALEARPLPQPVTLEKAVDLAPVQERLSRLELQQEMKAAELTPLSTSVTDLTKDVGAIRERLAVAETRAGVPGPPGQDGEAGADGLGLEDFSVDFDGERTFTLKYSRGERVKTAGAFTLPVLIYRGVYAEGKTYQAGDVVSYAGNAWHCKRETTIKPDYMGQGPQPKDFWTLMVKEGRAGKDGRDGLVPSSVVTVGSRK